MSPTKFLVTRDPHPDLLPLKPGEEIPNLSPPEPVSEHATYDEAVEAARNDFARSNMPHYVEQDGRRICRLDQAASGQVLVERY